MSGAISPHKRAFEARVQKWLALPENGGKTVSDYQRWVRSRASYEVCAANGYKGAMATIQRHGFGHLYRLMVKHQKEAPPSRPVQFVMDILADLDPPMIEELDYEREWEPLGSDVCVSVDLGLFFLKKAIEVNGKPHSDPFFGDQERRHQNQLAKIAKLEIGGILCLVLDYTELTNANRDCVLSQIREFIWS
jgi:hypothetical protein